MRLGDEPPVGFPRLDASGTFIHEYSGVGHPVSLGALAERHEDAPGGEPRLFGEARGKYHRLHHLDGLDFGKVRDLDLLDCLA